ncbi:MAG TPA: BNR-repeat neuraminidase N-terminal domain-containing protein [Candidatus Cloacimonadota bacterium]|nr:BNR-repeat neuraminidase N-terminal domain-containing protein [Candidatus Cloacimonadota bacterium]
MHKTIIVCTFLFLVLSSISIFAQTTVTIGTGTSVTFQYPTACHFGYTRTAAIYTSAEIGMNGQVTTLGWYATAAQNVTIPCKIYLKETSATSLTATTWASMISGATLVYNSYFYSIPMNAWYSVALPTPYFNHTGSNLLVLVECNYGGSGAGSTKTAGIRHTYYATPNAEQWVANTTPPTGNGSLPYYRPNIQITLLNPMSVTSITTTQNTAKLKPGTDNQQVISIPITANGSGTLNVTQFTLNANGSTSTSDFSNAKIFYTGTSNVFTATTQFGTTYATPTSTNFTIDGTQALAVGTNYFWLAYDISPSATLLDVVDAECPSVTIGGSPYAPLTTAPAGSRTISGPITGIKTIGSGGDYATFTSAINEMNILGIGDEGVTFKVSSGQTFVEDPPAITVTGTPDNPVVFEKSDVAHAVLVPTGGAGTSDFGICVQGGDYFTFDGIDIVNNSAYQLEYGYYLNGSLTDGVNFNTIKNCTISLNTGNYYSTGIYLYTTGSNSTNKNTNNHFYNLLINNVTCGIAMIGSGSTGVDDTGNEIGILSDGLTTISNIANVNGYGYGINIANQKNCRISNVGMNNLSGALTACGINASGSNSLEIFSNTVNLVTGIAQGYGFNLNGGTFDVHHNMISNITSSYIYGQTYGLYLSSNSATNIYNNTIHDVSQTGAGTSPVAYGMEIIGTNIAAYNNFVYGVNAANSSASPAVIGVYAYPGNGSISFLNNSVSIAATSGLVKYDTVALYHNPSNGTLDLRNNILVNNSAVGSNGTGKAVSFWQSPSTLPNLAGTTNNNLYYAGTPGAQHLIYLNGANSYQTLAAYQTQVTPLENASVTENPPFVSATDLHIQTTVITKIESNGLLITSPVAITNDIDGDLRSTSNPDIGADEGEFMPVIVAPNPAVLVSPADTALDQLLDATLNWSNGVGGGAPTAFILNLGTDYPPSNIINHVNIGYLYTYSPTLLSGTTYYWQIIPTNSAGNATGCPIWSFSTLALPLAAVNPIPADAATDVARDASLAWDAVSGAASYDVYFGATLPVTPNINVSVPTWTPALMDAGTLYYWKVAPKNAAGEAIDCPTWTFTTIPLPNLDPPTNLIVNRDGTDMILTWNLVSGASSYNVYTSTNPHSPIYEWVLLDNVTINTYTDSNPTHRHHFYHVTSVR